MDRTWESAISLDASAAQRKGMTSVRLAHLLDRTIFGSLLALMAGVAIPYGTVEPWWESLFECAAFLLAALYLIEGWLRDSWQVRGGALLAPLLGLVTFAWGQSLSWAGAAPISADPYNTKRFAVKLLALVLACGMFLRYTNTRNRMRTLVFSIIGVAVASAVFGLLRQTAQGDAPDFILPFLPAGTGYGQFINRNHFAFLMELALGLTLGVLLAGRAEHQRSRSRWLIGIAISLPLWMALVLSNSRGGIFSMLCQVLFVALIYKVGRASQPAVTIRQRVWRRSGQLALAACLLLTLAGGTVWIGGDPLIARLETAADEVNLDQPPSSEGIRRVEVWRSSWQLSHAYWLTGVGFGGYWAAIPQYHEGSGRLIPEEAHNDYLEVLASGGLIGALLAGWFLAALVWRAQRALRLTRDPWQRGARLGALTGLFAVAVHSVFDFGLHLTVNALVALALVVIATSEEQFDSPVEALNAQAFHPTHELYS